MEKEEALQMACLAEVEGSPAVTPRGADEHRPGLRSPLSPRQSQREGPGLLAPQCFLPDTAFWSAWHLSDRGQCWACDRHFINTCASGVQSSPGTQASLSSRASLGVTCPASQHQRPIKWRRGPSGPRWPRGRKSFCSWLRTAAPLARGAGGSSRQEDEGGQDQESPKPTGGPKALSGPSKRN